MPMEPSPVVAQNAAAITYLDPVALYIADEELTAALADTEQPTGRSRLALLLRNIARLTIVAVIAGVAAAALVPGDGPAPASAATSPFANAVWQTMVAATGLRCTGTEDADRVASCSKGSLAVTVEAYVGPQGTMFVVTFTRDGVVHREILRVYIDRRQVDALLALAQRDPAAYPNLRSGPNWVLTGTDPVRSNIGGNPGASPSK